MIHSIKEWFKAVMRGAELKRKRLPASSKSRGFLR